MIPTDLVERRKMIKRMIESCVNNIDYLSKWENDFLISIGEQFSDNGNLTDRQCEILEKIHDKA